MSTLRAYVEGYDAYLHFVRIRSQWSRIISEEEEARQLPYGLDEESNLSWQEGWRDARAETFIPAEIAQRFGCPAA